MALSSIDRTSHFQREKRGLIPREATFNNITAS